MKTLFISFVILSIYLSNASLDEPFKSQLTEFFNSLFSTQELKSHDILACFNEDSSRALFKFMDDVILSLEYILLGDYEKFDEEHWKLATSQLDFIDSLECAYDFPEMKAFLKSIGLDDEFDDSLESLKLRWDLFYTGNPEKLMKYLIIVQAYFQTGYAMDAGLYLGEVVSEMMKYTNPRANAMNSWLNGIYKGLNLSPPIELHRCFDEKFNLRDHMNNLYYFYYLWSGIASRALPAFSLETTEEYLTEASKNFQSLISSDLWKCVHDGPDSKRMRVLVNFNLNPYDESFEGILKKFLSNNYQNAWTYQTVMGSLEADWKNGYYFQNGEDFSKFMQELRTVYGGFVSRNFTLEI